MNRKMEFQRVATWQLKLKIEQWAIISADIAFHAASIARSWYVIAQCIDTANYKINIVFEVAIFVPKWQLCTLDDGALALTATQITARTRRI